ncbi:hypothetical protein PIB30_075861 [Stylosanthes scabra]|uniref:Ubiquitin-like protease family profile domain-containing protein n=1 Tax=Stylosanthes scabra TaxID=79078 RepID=A0ABU6XR42_9FABA|nr:hypothetical protein [Stylosanthes scabra]
MRNRFTWGWSRFAGLEAIEGSKSSPSESILLSMESQQRTIGSSKCMWGLCFPVGQRLTSRLTMRRIVNDRGRLIGPRGSKNDGHPVQVLDQSGLAMITDRYSVKVRTWSFVLTPYNFSGRYRYMDYNLARIMKFMVLCPVRFKMKIEKLGKVRNTKETLSVCPILLCRKLKSLVVGTRNIPITVELIGRCLGFPNNRNSFKAIETSEEHEITDSLKGKTVKSLKDDVKKCTMHNEDDLIFFRRHFLMLVLKCFYLATNRAVVSEVHINAVIDIKDTRKIYWARYIYDHLISAVLQYQDSSKKTVDGCMYALLGLLYNVGTNTTSSSITSSRKRKRNRVVQKRSVVKKPSYSETMRRGQRTIDVTVPDKTPKRTSNDNFDKASDTSPLDPSMPSFSIGLTQLDTSDTQHTTPVTMEREDVIHTPLPSRTIARPTGADMERIYRWATNSRAKNDITLAWIKNGDNIKIIRRDLKSMGTRKQLCDKVVDYCCAMFNAADNQRFRKSFYCFTPRIMVRATASLIQLHELDMMLTDKNVEGFMGPRTGYFPFLSTEMGEGNNWFKVDAALKRDYWFVPVCQRDHCWLYVLHRKSENLWVLDSVNKESNSYRRKTIDAYVGMMLKDLAAFVDNEIIFTGDGYDCCYEPSIGTQPNTWDSGIYIIKWMEMWDPNSMTDDAPLMPRWDNNDLQHIRKELVMDMLFCKDNVSRELVDGVLNEP